MNISGYLLSTSPENILGFYGLPVETWKHGFQTQEEVFAWLKKSWLYKPMLLVEADAMSRRKLDPALREMYFAFIKLADADSNDQLKGVPNLQVGDKSHRDCDESHDAHEQCSDFRRAYSENDSTRQRKNL